MLKDGTLYQDLGANHFDERAKGKHVLRLVKETHSERSMPVRFTHTVCVLHAFQKSLFNDAFRRQTDAAA
jgi:hypothetical protein